MAQPAPYSGPFPDGASRSIKILLLGQKGSGKTSAVQVLFKGMSPRQAMRDVRSTRQVQVEDVNILRAYQIWDTPTSVTAASFGNDIAKFSAIIWFVDFSSSYQGEIVPLALQMWNVYLIDKNVRHYVFLNKCEALTAEDALEQDQTFSSDFNEELNFHMEQHPSYDPSTDTGPGMPDPNYIQTTMFDERLPKAFHEVTVKAFPEALAHVQGVMGTFAGTHKLETFALIDRPTKICVVSAGEEGANKDKERLIFQWIGRVDLFEDLYKSVIPEQALTLPPPPPPSSKPNGDSQLNGSSIASSQPPPPPAPTTSNPPLSPQEESEDEESESESEEEDGEEEEEEEEEEGGGTSLEEDRHLCQSVSMEVGVTFVSWSITDRLSIVGTLPTSQFEADKAEMRKGMIVVRRIIVQFEQAHDEWFRET
ncbi:Gtr1/RagA G protein conserved region-domain-containing protein [Mrakia frigida]|uniref:Gtr1/RagA G protein conserved region-domain-containing protein n=1 Tax=Mrakia frigida TaxID=29902 RepID=UPI003FCBF207